MAAGIHLTDGRSLSVSESVAEVHDAITSLGPGITPMIQLTEFGPVGQLILVCASNITSVKELG